uniref:hypothetical protein n=1 Tax=Salmonella sp. s54412 TaxID=3160128 RepID=UPI003754C947
WKRMASSDSEGNTSDVIKEKPRKRGRPAKIPNKEELDEEEVDEDVEEVPKAKRSPGRPKGAKNKSQKEKPDNDGPRRPRGRPRKWPPVEKPTGPKRKRGRPKKNQEVTNEGSEES